MRVLEMEGACEGRIERGRGPRDADCGGRQVMACTAGDVRAAAGHETGI